MNQPLSGTVALITGASSGIGAATARALVAAGGSVVLVARRAELLRKLKDELGPSVHTMVVDLLQRGAADEIMKAVLDLHGRLDIVINNAGIVDIAPIEAADLSRFEQMLLLNAMVPMQITKASIPHLRANGRGHIVNLSSTSGLFTAPGAGGYSASKHAVEAFSEALRREVSKADSIRVTVIEPGPVATEFASHIQNHATRQGIADWFASITPLQAEDVADSILFALTRPRRVTINRLLIRPTDSDTEL